MNVKKSITIRTISPLFFIPTLLFTVAFAAYELKGTDSGRDEWLQKKKTTILSCGGYRSDGFFYDELKNIVYGNQHSEADHGPADDHNSKGCSHQAAGCGLTNLINSRRQKSCPG